MARTALVPAQTSPAGAVATFSAANVDGHRIPGSGHVVLIVNNASGGSINVTIQTPATVDGLAVADQVVAVGAGVIKAMGPFPAGTYARPSGASDPGEVYVDFSSVTTVTVMAVQG